MRLTVIAPLLLLSGAAAALAQPAPVNPNQTRQVAAKPATARQPPQSGRCDVGVISHLGEKFNVRQIGFTVFGNETNEVSIEPWRVDDLVVAKIGGALGKRGIVRRVAYRKEAFASLETPKLLRDIDAELGEGVRTLTADTHCARYVIVTDGTSRYGTTNQILGGLGIVAGKKPFFTGDLYNLYTLITLRVYDGETFAMLKRKFATTGESTFMTMIAGPHREVDQSFWPAPLDGAAQNAKLRDAVRDLIGQSLDATLPELPL